MFFGNETDRFLKKFFDPFGFETDACNGGFCCETEQKRGEEEENDISLRNNPSVQYYGFVATVGPDGRPIVREYGNVKGPTENNKLQREKYLQPTTTPSSKTKEPLIDTIVDEKEKVVKLIAEIPGVEKRDIKITVDGKYVSVSADGHGGKQYRIQIPLECKVNENSARATYRNGILQITFNLIEGSQGGKTIKIN